MDFKLGNTIKADQKIKTIAGWRKIVSVKKDGVIVKEGLIKFGETIYGWKVK